MDRQQVIKDAEMWAKQKLGGDSSGHDWWHIERVRNMAVRLASETGADGFICEMAALLHDLADEKLFGDEEKGLQDIGSWLLRHGTDRDDAAHIVDIISHLSFKGGGRAGMATLEGRVVQDADRLDAIGAVGIARTFAYSGWKGQPMHDPDLAPRETMSTEQYRQGKSTAYNHFYEKLLKLKSLMNTDEARVIAEERHRFMVAFLERFKAEWNGTDA